MVKKAPVRASSGSGGQSKAASMTTTLSGVPNVRGHSARTAAPAKVSSPTERGGGGSTKRAGRPVAPHGAQRTGADRTGTVRQSAIVRARTFGRTRAGSGSKGSGSVAGRRVRT